ncbi:MAG: hypothetical protein GXO78_02800 [Calditrichaeota bacterium]|nr:hypothetical protein [Calditrichota bacterium]
MKNLIGFLLICGTLSSLLAQKVVLPLKRDDFTEMRGWWDYHRDGTVAQDPEAIQVRNGYLYLQLKNPVDSLMCNVGISDHQGIYKKKIRWLIFEARVKVLNPMKPGSRGWGFWRMTVPGKPSSLAWFMQQLATGADAPRFTFWKAGVVHLDQRKDVNVPVNPQQWHHYRVVRDMEQQTTRFYVDGKEILVAHGIVPRERLSLHVWIDNMVYGKTFGARMMGWSGISAMVVDYVQVRTFLQEERVFDPRPLVPFRVQPLTLPMGHENDVWKEYTFETMAGTHLVLVTARAEYYDFHSPPDYLKVDVRANGQYWPGNWDWQGIDLRGQSRTTMRQLELPSGKIRIILETRTTPAVNDVTVIRLEKGRMLVNEVLNRSPAESGDSLLWRDYRFRAQSGQLVVFVSGRVRENPGWNPVHPASRREQEDDDLWVELMNASGTVIQKRFICGNQQFGEDRSMVFSTPVAAGEYRLRIWANGKPLLYRVLVAQ